MIKNIDAIKAKAKQQIIELLDRMGCYKYSNEGIDKWLNAWEDGCEKQITEIAEKSPYYDGDCKIVFPAEYPREINNYQISEFAKWLNNFAARNIKEAKIEGLASRDTKKLIDINEHLCAISGITDDICGIVNEEILNKLRDIISLVNSEDYVDIIRLAYDVRRKFNLSCNYGSINGKIVDVSEYNALNDCPSKLAYFLNTPDGRKQFLTDEAANLLREFFPNCRFAKGQKLSKAVMKIAKKYNLTSDPEWEKEFAKFADAINPLTVVKWTIISWHPIDYLTFCFGDSWSSCCTIDRDNVRGIKIGKSRSSITNYINDEDYAFRGEHSAAALSYMFDDASFIYYTVSDKYKGNLYEEQPKNTRIVFSLSKDNTTLLQSRLYPQCNDDNPNDTPYRIPREIVQKVICDSLEVPNLWTVKKGSRMCSKWAISDGVHYADYKDERNKQCNISYRGEEPTPIYIGRDAICPKCGRYHNYVGSLNCIDCDPYY